MSRTNWLRAWGGVLACAVMVGGAGAARADLHEYVKKPEPKYDWKLKEKRDSPAGVVYDLELTSQEWHDIVWKHQLEVYQPKDVAPNGTMFLFNTGGKADIGTRQMGLELARKIKAPVAFLYHIPNQPLFDGKKEDALIAETFVRHLESKDDSWPLLFPMVKSVVKAMDALQAFAQQEWKQPVKGFILSGASKRGWTTWLTAAADPRVVAFAPLVIDTLNMTDQMAHQKKSFGAYSAMIRDYTERKLVPLPDKEEARRLWKMVDPYFYRDRLTQPKLLVNGNNDPYWTVDALNLYWDDLKGDKWVTYVPNAGHDLKEPDGSRTHVEMALAAFARHQITGKPMPALKWKHEGNGDKARLRVETSVAPTGARLWVAEAATRDFRKSKWVEQPATCGTDGVTGEVTPPAEGFKVFYAELDYEIDGIKYHLSTQVRMLGKDR